MRKTAMILAVVMVLTMLAVPVMAEDQRMAYVIPSLTFQGNNALCEAQVSGNAISDTITATVKLYRAQTCIATWTVTGTGDLLFQETKRVAKGYTYTLTIDVTINDTVFPTMQVSDKYE